MNNDEFSLSARSQILAKNIHVSGMTIYDKIEIDDIKYWMPTEELQFLLNKGLVGLSLAGLPLRTRSKVVKEAVCNALGYAVPKSFKKTQPRFPGQLLDIYTQKSNNLQIWNEEISEERRYALIRISAEDKIERVKVINGKYLIELDTTGTLTTKYQARCLLNDKKSELVSPKDTRFLSKIVKENISQCRLVSPIDNPKVGEIFSIAVIFEKLSNLIGCKFRDAGVDQERNRGAELHRHVCKILGYEGYQDDGQFPDVRHQLLEVKLQTSPTIDLGLVRPDSDTIIELGLTGGVQVRHCDVRYAVFYAKIN